MLVVHVAVCWDGEVGARIPPGWGRRRGREAEMKRRRSQC